ncbi:MAG: AbrB/MazE/SpoVT family DNA-binding domain-containing protein [Myxococcota bacterium]
MKAVVSEKGQVTIPKALRERLGLRAGVHLEFSVEEGRLIAKKAENTADPVDRAFGILRNERATDELILERRGSADAIEP